jgi:hypothetical protein
MIPSDSKSKTAPTKRRQRHVGWYFFFVLCPQPPRATERSSLFVPGEVTRLLFGFTTLTRSGLPNLSKSAETGLTTQATRLTHLLKNNL